MFLFFLLIFALLGGPLLAWLYTTSFGAKAFERRKRMFAEKGGRDPEKDPIGPHKSFRQNLLGGMVVMGGIGAAIGLGAQLATGG